MSNYNDDEWGMVLKGVSDIGFNPIIKVIGVGGGGSNAVDYMYRQGIDMVDFIVCNTDIQALRNSHVTNRIQIGKTSTEGLGAGCRPERGGEAADENMDDIRSLLEHNTKVLFITAGMGGGTGTGAAPKIAKLSKELGILTIGIVSVPFEFEGKRKIIQAMRGIDEMEQYVDAMSIIVNDRLLDDSRPVKLSEAFAMADSVLAMATKSIADIIMVPGFVNIDLSDVYKVLRGSGVALIGSGEGHGENRAVDAIKAALLSPLLRDRDITGASDILVLTQYGAKEVYISEHMAIMNYISTQTKSVADIIWGTSRDNSLGDDLRVAIVVTGFKKGHIRNQNTCKEVHQTAVSDRKPLHAEKDPEKMQVGSTKVLYQKPDLELQADFKVEPKVGNLVLELENSEEIERAAVRRKSKPVENKERDFTEPVSGSSSSPVQDTPKKFGYKDIAAWIENKLGSKGDDYRMS